LAQTLEPLEVRRHGAGAKTLVALHGGPGAAGCPGLARALAADFLVLEPVQRRSGRVPLSVAQHVADLAQVAPRPARLVGTSWGAMLALSYAARHPHDTEALVLVGCGTYDEASRALYRDALERRLAPARAEIDSLQRRLAAETERAKRDALFGALGAAFMRAESYEPVYDDDGAPPADEAGHLETWRDALRLQSEGVEPAAFRAIRARVLMIHGDVDPHPGPATRDLLRRFVPQLEYVELERCGHEPWRERHARQRFVEQVRAWL
jgi:pimeloyl-ACP methyl ester carboxylesterase